jgi:tetratricopeptide (TPR) repeat protein
MLEELIEKEQMLIQTEQYEQARRILMMIIRDNQNCIEALNDLAVVEIMEGKFQSGLELFYEVLKIDPKNEDAQVNIEYVKNQIKQQQ